MTTAIDIKNALSNIYVLESIGSCPTMIQAYEYYYGIDENEDEEEDEDEDEDGGNKAGKAQKDIKSEEHLESNNVRIFRSQAIFEHTKTFLQDAIKALRDIFDNFPLPASTGYFHEAFHLRVTREGCQFDGKVHPGGDTVLNLLPEWLKHAAVSGYGDVRNQATKIDLDVRNACEIPSDEFSVDKELLDRIEAEWAESFLPRKVQAKPYKIHLYGPEGHFKSHRDTPEMNLVGTFLLGLGDTVRGAKGSLVVNGIENGLTAEPCSWVAFHPDVPHAVLSLPKSHYRAVIAFKIFSAPDNSEPTENAIQTSVNEALAKMRPPFGIFLDRQYCMGTSKLSGFDTILLTAAYSRKDKCRIYTLPVITKFNSKRGVGVDHEIEPLTETKVYPFTEAHVDVLLGRRANATSEVPWLKDVKDLPFYYLRLDENAITWAEKKDDGAEYTGNESRPASQDSIYLSYSLVVLPGESVEGDESGK